MKMTLCQHLFLFTDVTQLRAIHPSDTSRNELKQTDTLYNWAAFGDLAVEHGALSTTVAPSLDIDNQVAPAHTVVGTSGQNSFGAISPLRHGYEAIVDELIQTSEDTFEQSDPDDSDEAHVNSSFARLGHDDSSRQLRIWGMRLREDCWAFLLSSATDTKLLLTPRSSDTELDFRPCGLETLAATRMQYPQANSPESCHMLLQVTVDTIYVLRLDTYEQASVQIETSISLRSVAQKAAVDRSARIIATVSNQILNFASVMHSNGTVHIGRLPGEAELEMNVTCITLFCIAGFADQVNNNPKHDNSKQLRFVCVVATEGGMLEFFGVNMAGEVANLHTYSFTVSSHTGPPNICHSLAYLEVGRNLILVCGLRNGTGLYFPLFIDPATPRVATSDSTKALRLGNSSLELRYNPETPSSIFACCDGNVVLLDFSKPAQPIANYVWFTNPGDRSERFSIADLNLPDSSSGLGEQSLCALSFKGDILLARLGDMPKPLPLRLHIPGKPMRMLFSRRFNCFFVASHVCFVEDGRRYITPQIFVVDREMEDYQTPRAAYSAEPGQRILGLVEWAFKGQDKRQRHYHLVATTNNRHARERDEEENRDARKQPEEGNRDARKRPEGNLIILRIAKQGDEIILEERKMMGQSSPVTAICQFDNNSMIFCAEDKLKRLIYNPAEGRYSIPPPSFLQTY